MSSAPPGFAAARRRLLGLIVLVVVAILALTTVAVYLSDANAIDQQINQELADRATHDSSYPDATAITSAAAPVEHDARDLYDPASPNVFVIGLDSQGHITSDPGNVGAQGLPDRAAVLPVLGGEQNSTLVTVALGGHAFRLYTVPVRQNGRIVGAVQTGMSLDARDRQLRDLLVTLALVGLGAVALAVVAGVALAERAMAPARLAYERQRQFAAAASHELRTPLAVVRSQAELIARRLRRAKPPAGRELAADADEVVAETDYMTRLVGDLLLLAREAPDAGGLATQPVDLAALAHEVAEKLRGLAAKKAIDLAVAGGPPAEVQGEPDRLRQLLLILLENALRYTPAGGKVRVRVWTEAAPRLLGGTHVRCAVSDTGVGIAPEQHRRVFEPFFRVDPARTEDDGHQGAGLGLALADWIARAHGGTIALHSVPGEGSTFTVSLPEASRQESDS